MCANIKNYVLPTSYEHVERFVNIGRVEGRRFDEVQIIYLRVLLNLWYRYSPLLVRQVCFITHEQNAHSFRPLLLQLLNPIVNIHERFVVRDIVHY